MKLSTSVIALAFILVSAVIATPVPCVGCENDSRKENSKHFPSIAARRTAGSENRSLELSQDCAGCGQDTSTISATINRSNDGYSLPPLPLPSSQSATSTSSESTSSSVVPHGSITRDCAGCEHDG
ncbi:hypothetical protein DFH11DRAFT_463791 [Phellopilus nigrolimitatus]|nr:hypothetical protein DFH11DRAFT_463791 [Phellopilus nigrolimitatus]